MPKNINDLDLFSRVETAPAGHVYDKGRREKHWADPAALQSAEDMVVYKTFVKLADGKPVWKNIFLTPHEAATLNIPPANQTADPAAPKPEWPFPARDLADDEVIVVAKGTLGGGLYQIVTAAELAAQEEWEGISYSRYDRSILERLAAKQGVI